MAGSRAAGLLRAPPYGAHMVCFIILQRCTSEGLKCSCGSCTHTAASLDRLSKTVQWLHCAFDTYSATAAAAVAECVEALGCGSAPVALTPERAAGTSYATTLTCATIAEPPESRAGAGRARSNEEPNSALPAGAKEIQYYSEYTQTRNLTISIYSI